MTATATLDFAASIQALVREVGAFAPEANWVQRNSKASAATTRAAFAEMKRLMAVDGDPVRGSRSLNTIIRRRNAIQLAFAAAARSILNDLISSNAAIPDVNSLTHSRLSRLRELWLWSKRPLADILPPNHRARRQSKRDVLKKMPKDRCWLLKLIQAVPKRNNRLGIVILALTGARPCELAKGVLITRSTNGAIDILITTAKDRSGHSRKFRIASNSALAAELENTVGVVRVSSEALRATIRRVSATLFPRVKLTPYVLRHAFASAVKQVRGIAEAAKALGHSQAKTTTRYGSSRLAVRAGGIVPPAMIFSMKSVRPRPPWDWSRRLDPGPAI